MLHVTNILAALCRSSFPNMFLLMYIKENVVIAIFVSVHVRDILTKHKETGHEFGYCFVNWLGSDFGSTMISEKVVPQKSI